MLEKSKEHNTQGDGNHLRGLQTPANEDRITFKVAEWNNRISVEGWSVQLGENFNGRPALQKGRDILQSGGPLIVGMSLENSYFSLENIAHLFRFLQTLQTKIYVVVMDEPSEHNYRALGYSEDKAAKKIKKKEAELHRAIEGALEQVAGSPEQFCILKWNSIRRYEGYQHARQYVESLYLNNNAFRADVTSTVRSYIIPRLKNLPMTEAKQIQADKYLLEELAFLLCSCKFLDHEAAVYLYHREWPIFECLINGAYSAGPIKDLGFIELKVS